MDTSELDGAKYVALTTYKRDGSAVSTAMWLEGSGGTYHCMTGADAWKVRRIRNNPEVELAVSDRAGKITPGATRFSGIAKIIEGPSAQPLIASVKKKYGAAATMIGMVTSIGNRFKRKSDPGQVAIQIEIGWGAGG